MEPTIYKPSIYNGAGIYNNGGGGGGNNSVIAMTDLKPLLMPDGREWTTINLDVCFYGTTFGAENQDTSMQTSAPLEIESYITACGLAYNAKVVDYIHTNKATICPGWDVPVKSELENLVTACGGNNNGLKDAGFNPIDDARVYSNGQWDLASDGTYIWSRSSWHPGFNFALYTKYTGGYTTVREEYRSSLLYIRLIKEL